MSTYYVAGIPYSDELYHFGIKGQKWGIRRFQNLDRTWTEAGKERYGKIKDRLREDVGGQVRYYKEKHEKKKELTRQYNRDIAKMPEWLAKKNYNKSLRELEKELSAKYPKESRNNKRLEDIAQGVLIAAAVGCIVYGAASNASVINSYFVQADIEDKFDTDRAADLIGKAMDIDISSLSDRDEVITAGTVLQRIIRSGNNLKETMKAESAKDFIYATFNKNDNEIYKSLFNARGRGKKIAVSRKLVSELRMPSAFKSASTFKELLSRDDFRSALMKDMFLSPSDFDRWSDGNLWNYFNSIAGDARKESPKMFFSAIRDKGYNAIRDFNDSGYLGHDPIILLNASNDSVITGKKVVGSIREMISGLKMRHVEKYDRRLIYS